MQEFKFNGFLRDELPVRRMTAAFHTVLYGLSTSGCFNRIVHACRSRKQERPTSRHTS